MIVMVRDYKLLEVERKREEKGWKQVVELRERLVAG